MLEILGILALITHPKAFALACYLEAEAIEALRRARANAWTLYLHVTTPTCVRREFAGTPGAITAHTFADDGEPADWPPFVSPDGGCHPPVNARLCEPSLVVWHATMGYYAGAFCQYAGDARRANRTWELPPGPSFSPRASWRAAYTAQFYPNRPGTELACSCGSTEPAVDDGDGSWPHCPSCGMV